MSEPLLITPQTKVGELLETYPELEEVLVALAPPFKKLRKVETPPRAATEAPRQGRPA